MESCFVADLLPPLKVTIFGTFFISCLGYRLLRNSGCGLLPRFYLILYVLLFTACVGYLFDDNYVFWYSHAAIPLCLKHHVINIMITIGLAGLLGLLSGIETATEFYQKNQIFGRLEKKSAS